MTKNNEIQTEYYGIITATINHKIRLVDLTMKRYTQPVSNNQVESMLKWALRSLGEKFPDYKITTEVSNDA